MLFTTSFLEGVADGRYTLAFRRWRDARVRAGSRMRTFIGVLEVDAVEQVEAADISARDVQRAGFDSKAALLDSLDTRGGAEAAIFRIALHLAGPDPRIALREQAPSTTDLEELRSRLDRLDAAARRGGHEPWTTRVLALIADRPEGTRAATLAAALSQETQPFKLRVRKLKELGLTESLEVGYRLSPRGRALLAHLRADR